MTHTQGVSPIDTAQTIALRRVEQTPTWKCLVDVFRSRGAAITITDTHLRPLASSTPPRSPEVDDATRARADAAFAERRPLAVWRDQLCAVFTPIDDQAHVVGAVVITGQPPDIDEAQLTRAGALLAQTMAEELSTSRSEGTGTARRVASLHQLLHTVANEGRDRDIIQLFAEALSVWEDAETFAYRGDLSGSCGLAFALPGSDRATVPAEIDRRHIPHDFGARPLSSVDAEALGFRASTDTVLILVATDSDGGLWLLAMRAPAPATDRLELYVAALRVAFAAALARETARLTWAMMQHFVEAASPADGVTRALTTLSVALGAQAGCAVWTADGRLILSSGRIGEEASGTPPVRTATVLQARLDKASGVRAILSAHVEGGRTFAGRERLLFEAAVDTFRSWLTSAAGQLAGASDRRRDHRSFDQVIARHVNDPDAALILISPADPQGSAHATLAWIGHVRAQLRPTDLTGRLASGDFAVLALDTPPAGALAVAHRLAHTFLASAHPIRPVVRVGTPAAITPGDPIIDHDRLTLVEVSSTTG